MKETKTQKYGKIHYIHKLEFTVLLKYSYFAKQSTDLMQSLSGAPWYLLCFLTK